MTEEEFYKSLNERASSINTHEKELGMVMPALMRKVYIWMALALIITGVAAYGVASSPTLLMSIFSHPGILIGMIIAEFALVIMVSARIDRLSLNTATLLFIAYSILNGVMLSSIFVLYTTASITRVFFIAAGTFAATAVYGYTTKKDLSRIGQLAIMALLGIIIATVVNMFLKSTGFDLILSYIAVIVFVGLTAWDVQSIKKMLLMQYDMNEGAQKVALLGALTLYLDFINLFLYLLRIFGRSDN